MKRKTEKLSAGVDKRGTGKVKSKKDRRPRRAEAEGDREAVGLKLHCWLRFVGLSVCWLVGLLVCWLVAFWSESEEMNSLIL